MEEPSDCSSDEDAKALKDTMYEGSHEGFDMLLLAFTEFHAIFEEAENDLFRIYANRLETLLGHEGSLSGD